MNRLPLAKFFSHVSSVRCVWWALLDERFVCRGRAERREAMLRTLRFSVAFVDDAFLLSWDAADEYIATWERTRPHEVTALLELVELFILEAEQPCRVLLATEFEEVGLWKVS